MASSSLFSADFSAAKLRADYYAKTDSGREARALLLDTASRIQHDMNVAILRGQRTQEFTIPINLPRELGVELLTLLSNLQFIIQYSHRRGDQEVTDASNKWCRYDLIADGHVNPFNGSVFLRLCV
jgi:hypothetical protein